MKYLFPYLKDSIEIPPNISEKRIIQQILIVGVTCPVSLASVAAFKHQPVLNCAHMSSSQWRLQYEEHYSEPFVNMALYEMPE